MISAIFTTISQAVTSFVSALGNAVSGVTSMFWDAEASGGGQLTVLGTLLLIASGVGLVYFGFRLIRGLIRTA